MHAAMLCIDFVIDRPMHVAVIWNGNACRFDARKHSVEIFLAHPKTKVNYRNRISPPGKIERQTIVYKYRCVWSNGRFRPRYAEKVGQQFAEAILLRAGIMR